MIAFDYADGKAVLQLGHGANQKRGFSGAGARDCAEDEQVVGAEARAVVGGKPIILAENVTLDWMMRSLLMPAICWPAGLALQSTSPPSPGA